MSAMVRRKGKGLVRMAVDHIVGKHHPNRGGKHQHHEIILLHGLLSSRRGWGRFGSRLLQALETQARSKSSSFSSACGAVATTHSFRIHALDCRNHGDSIHTDHHSLEAISDDLSLYMEENEISSPILMGHSMGGKAALLHAMRHGHSNGKRSQARLNNSVRCVVALDAAPCAYKTNHQYVFDAMRGLDLKTISRRMDADQQLKETIVHSGERAFILSNLVIDAQSKSGKWTPNLEVLSRDEKYVHDWPEEVPQRQFTGPALFVGGNLSTRLTTPSHLDAVSHKFPRGVVVMVPAGHFVHHAAAMDTVEHIADFLSVELKLPGAIDPQDSPKTFKKIATGATIRALCLEESDEVQGGIMTTEADEGRRHHLV